MGPYFQVLALLNRYNQGLQPRLINQELQTSILKQHKHSFH
jgi:hypothetical protein